MTLYLSTSKRLKMPITLFLRMQAPHCPNAMQWIHALLTKPVMAMPLMKAEHTRRITACPMNQKNAVLLIHRQMLVGGPNSKVCLPRLTVMRMVCQTNGKRDMGLIRMTLPTPQRTRTTTDTPTLRNTSMEQIRLSLSTIPGPRIT